VLRRSGISDGIRYNKTKQKPAAGAQHNWRREKSGCGKRKTGARHSGRRGRITWRLNSIIVAGIANMCQIGNMWNNNRKRQPRDICMQRRRRADGINASGSIALALFALSGKRRKNGWALIIIDGRR